MTRRGYRSDKRLGRRVGVVLLLVFLVVLFACGSLILRGFDGFARQGRGYLAHRLSTRHGLVLYVPFEKPRPVNLVTGTELLRHNLDFPEGRYGSGGEIDTDGDSVLWTDVSLGPFHEGAVTLAFWWKKAGDEPLRDETRLLWSHSKAAVFGIRLRDGRIEVVSTLSDGTRRTTGAPFEGKWDRFRHVAVVSSEKSVRLFLDGKEVAAEEFQSPRLLPYHFLGLGGDPRMPVHGYYDDLALWKRGLDGHEIRGIARSASSLSARSEPFVVASVRLLEAGGAFMKGFYRLFDRLAPHALSPATIRSDIPALELRVSKRDARHFRKANERTCGRGERTRKATRFRAISAFFKGRSERVEACLDDLDVSEHPSRRYSFELKAPPGFLAEGSGMARLYPPERWEALHPDALRPLPLATGRFVRLYLEGEFLGLYLLEPMDRLGSSWMVAGRRSPARTDFLLFGSQPTAETEEKGLPEVEVERRYRRIGALLRSDVHFPWSVQELRERERRFLRNRAKMAFAGPALSELDLKGSNPAAYYVVTNLDLSAAGAGVAWHSSAPEILSADGTVRRPSGEIPVDVQLRGDFPGAGSRLFRFRVIPDHPRLPALHFHFSLPLEKIWDRDFTCRLYPAGGGASRWITGTRGAGAGVHHRGNTSYVRAAKRSMSIEFDEPVDMGLPIRPSRHLLLLSGYADGTKLRNKLSFDCFHAMRATAVRRSPAVDWTEVFVNGEYAGIWEMATRPQDISAGAFVKMLKIRTPNGIWYSDDPDFLTYMGRPPLPPGAFDDFVEVSRFVIGSDSGTFLGKFDDYFDRGELIDFFLLLNFTGNFDGRVTNQLICRRADGRWECLPWDYDKTFMDTKGKEAWLYNPLFARLKSESPDFLDLVKARWATLRAGALSDQKLFGWYDRQVDFLAPCMADEYELLQPMDTTENFEEQAQALRSELRYRLGLLDRRLAP